MTQAPEGDDDTRPIRIGITLAEGGDAASLQRARLDAFAGALASVVGFAVTGDVFESYRALLESLDAGRVEVAWLPPVIALRAAARGRQAARLSTQW